MDNVRTFSFLLPEDLYKKIKEAGEQHGRKPGQEIRYMLKKIYLEDYILEKKKGGSKWLSGH
jgi:hypothetical protein